MHFVFMFSFIFRIRRKEVEDCQVAKNTNQVTYGEKHESGNQEPHFMLETLLKDLLAELSFHQSE